MKSLLSLLSIIFIFNSCDLLDESRDPITFSEASSIATNAILSQDSSVIIYGNPEIIKKGLLIFDHYFWNDTLNIKNESWLFIADGSYPEFNSNYATFIIVNARNGKINDELLWMSEDISQYEIIYPNVREPLSKERAIDEFEKLDLLHKSTSAIFMYPNRFLAGDNVLDGNGDEIYINQESWVFIKDGGYIRYNWPRSATFYIMSVNNGLVSKQFETALIDYSGFDTVYYNWQKQNRQLPNMNFNPDSKLGCCFEIVFCENQDETALLTINFDTTTFLSDTLEYSLSENNQNFEVTIRHYFYLPEYYYSPISQICSDTGSGLGILPQIWIASSGNVKIRRYGSKYKERMEIEFSNLSFGSNEIEGNLILQSLKLTDIYIGYCAG